MKTYAYLMAPCLLAGWTASPAAAQETQGQTAAQAGAEAATEDEDAIIVTAQRRAQRLLDVPMSIQVATGEELLEQGIKDLTALQFTTPGYMTMTNSGFTQIYMRGVGNAIYLGADPSVALFVDDVPRIYGSMADNLVDVERIEILKGAQGGLYGRNATGGVVNIISQRPSTDEARGNFLASYGEENTYRVAGFVNLPLTNFIALSLSAERAAHDPYVKNLATLNPYAAANFPNGAFLPVPNGTPPIPIGGGVNVFAYTPAQTAAFFNSPVVIPKLADQDFWFVRGKLLLKPVENLTIVLSGDYAKKDDNTGAGQVQLTPAITQAALGVYFGLFGITANLPPGFVPATTEKFASYAGFPVITPVREFGFSGTVTLETSHFDFTSITAYRDQQTALLADVNNVNVPTALLDVQFDKDFFYQELRAVSHMEGPLQLIFGATYLKNQQKGGQIVALLHPAFQVGNGFVEDTIQNWSAYVEGSYDVSERLNITASGRYMHEKNNAHFTLPIVSDAETVQKKFIPAVTVKYDIDDGNVYVRWARGFKTGGINLATAAAYYPRPEDGSVFGPETVDTFEAGYKGSLLDGKLQLTGAIFYNAYKDLQVDVRARPAFPQLTTAIVNADSARTWGVEGSATWRVADPLTLNVTAGYLNAKYKDFELVGSIALEDFDQSGFTMTKSPKWQLSFSGDLDQPLNDNLRLVGNLLVSYVSEVIFQHSPLPGIIPPAIGPAYWLVNARIGVKTADDKYGIALVADNLFDEDYFTFGQSAVTGVLAGWGNPRIIRVEATVRF